FMEGALIEHEGQRRLPSYKPEAAEQLLADDVSTWTDELCLFTGESALLYRPLEGHDIAYIGGPRGLISQAYQNHWAAIERGIEHVVAFRSEVQQIERITTDLLTMVPHLTRKVQDGDVTNSDVKEIEYLAANLSDIFDILPEQRGQSITATSF